MTSSRDVTKENSPYIAVLVELSSNNFTIVVLWYIKRKVFIQSLKIFLYFWSMTSSRDVTKEKPSYIAVLVDLNSNNFTIVVLWYIKWKVFIQSFQRPYSKRFGFLIMTS